MVSEHLVKSVTKFNTKEKIKLTTYKIKGYASPNYKHLYTRSTGG